MKRNFYIAVIFGSLLLSVQPLNAKDFNLSKPLQFSEISKEAQDLFDIKDLHGKKVLFWVQKGETRIKCEIKATNKDSNYLFVKGFDALFSSDDSDFSDPVTGEFYFKKNSEIHSYIEKYCTGKKTITLSTVSYGAEKKGKDNFESTSYLIKVKK